MAAIGACDGASPGANSAPTTVAISNPPPAVEPVQLAGPGMELHSWLISPAGDALVYTVFTRDGVVALRGVDGDATPWDIVAAPLREASFIFDRDGASLLIVDQAAGDGSDPRYRIQSVAVEGGAVTRLASGRNPIVPAGSAGNDVAFAAIAGRRTLLYSVDATTLALRELGEITTGNDGAIRQVSVVADHLVSVVDSGRSASILSVPVAGGRQVELPTATSAPNLALHGATPDGEVIVSQSDETVGPIYITSVDGEGPVTVLVTEAWSGTIRRDGEYVLFRDGEFREMRVSLDSGEIGPTPIEDQEEPDAGVVPQLEAESQRVWRVLNDGRWIVSGSYLNGPLVEAWREPTGAPRETYEVAPDYLFIYDPATTELLQISRDPLVSTTTTATGTSSAPERILRVRTLDDGELAAFATGFSGAAFDIESSLFLAPIPGRG